MHSLSSLVFPLLTTLLASSPSEAQGFGHSPPPQAELAWVPHTPSTINLEVGDARNVRMTAVQRGVGLLHTRSAQLGAPELLHLSALLGLSDTGTFPELSWGDSKYKYNEVRQMMLVVSATYTLLSWLEAYASYEASASSALREPRPSSNKKVTGQILGDVNLGLKAAYGLAPSFYAGLDSGVRFLKVDNSMRVAFRPALALTWNIQEVSSRVPLVLHSNAGVHLGRYRKIINENKDFATWKTFSWNLNSRHYGFVNFALELPLPYATPFVEYQASFPFWSKEDAAFNKAIPQSLVVGTKLTILPNLTVTLGGDIKLKASHTPGVVPLPPWRFFIGASIATAPFASVSVPQQTAPTSTRVEELPEPPALPKLVLALKQKQGGKLVPGQVHLRGPSPQSFQVSETTPTFNVPPGLHWLEILPAEGLAKIQKVNVESGQTLALMLDIESTPASPVLHFADQRIRFVEPLAFAPTKAELTAQGHEQLRNLVDLLVRNHIRKIRIESHVDSQRTEELAVQLSAQRSQAVVEQLVSLGMEAARLEVVNWGDSKPVAPNRVRSGRLLNRRVEFVVLEKWE